MDELARLAALIREQNRISGEIAALVGRPALVGHVGEFIAKHVFDIHSPPRLPTAPSMGILRPVPWSAARST